MTTTVQGYGSFQWIDLVQPSPDELLAITEAYDLDYNLIEDSQEPGHLPKIERIKGLTFIILRAYIAKEGEKVTTVEELSSKVAFFIKDRVLLTVHRLNFAFLQKIQDEYESPQALLLDIVGQMLLTFENPLDAQSAQMDEFEKDIFLQNGQSLSVEALYYEKSRARISRKLLQLTQHVLQQIHVSEGLRSALQDVQETGLSLILQCDEIMEDANNLLNTYMSVTAQKSNDVMKLLTVFSAFFLPLTFIAGIYGMNFQYMPELQTRYGYFATIGFMVLICALIYIWFKRKKIM